MWTKEMRYTDFIKQTKEYFGDREACVVAEMTDEYKVLYWSALRSGKEMLCEKKLLSVRIFDEAAELKLQRSDIGKELFHFRFREDARSDADSYDEFQFLDHSASLPEPLKDQEGIVIRHYLTYYENSGQAIPSDWRLVRFSSYEEFQKTEEGGQ